MRQDTTGTGQRARPSSQLIWHKKAHLAHYESPQEFRFAILNLDLGIPYVLENHAAHIWELTDGSRTVAETCTELHDIYGGNLQDISVQVDAFLAQLHSGHLVELAVASTPMKKQRN